MVKVHHITMKQTSFIFLLLVNLLSSGLNRKVFAILIICHYQKLARSQESVNKSQLGCFFTFKRELLESVLSSQDFSVFVSLI